MDQCRPAEAELPRQYTQGHVQFGAGGVDVPPPPPIPYEEAMADGIQILRYELGQAYVAHHDYFPTGQSSDHNWDPRTGGSNRWATVFLYLSDVEFGGQTVFPNQQRLTNETNEELVRRLGSAPSSEQLEKLLDQVGVGACVGWRCVGLG